MEWGVRDKKARDGSCGRACLGLLGYLRQDIASVGAVPGSESC